MDEYLDCGGISKFPIQSSNNKLKQAKLKDGTEYDFTETGYQIIPVEGSSGSSKLPSLFVSPQHEHNTVFNSQFYILDCKRYEEPLSSWLQHYKMIEDNWFCVQDSKGNNKYVFRPTKHALAIIKAIISAVGDLHTQNCCLSPNVIFGVNTVSKNTYDFEVEVIIDQNEACKKPVVRHDIQYLDNLIFSTILNVREGTVPCLPSGLLAFRQKLKTVGQPGGHNTLKQLLNHYSLANWEIRKQEIKSQHDGGLCLASARMLAWSALIPNQGVLCDFYNEPKSQSNIRGGPNYVAPYRDTKGELLRFMRNFFQHVAKKSYCDDDHKNLEYVETVLSETFHDFYSFFF